MKKQIILVSIVLISIFVFFAMAFKASAAPVEVWLTPERSAALKRISKRSYVTEKKRIDDDTVVYTWSNGLHTGAITTQKVHRVTGKIATSAWQNRLDEKDIEQAELLTDLESIKDKPNKKSIEALLEKHKGKIGKRKK